MSIWGKIIGGSAGFALGGPIGAVLGIMAGNVYDKSQKRNISNKEKQNLFALSVIILAAKISKSDGIVTKDEIYAFKEKFKISSPDMKQVGKVFNEAKKDIYGYEKIAEQVGKLFFNNKIVLEELLNNLFYIAEADGKISKNELNFLKSVAFYFNFDERTFQRIYQARLNDIESDPYKVLGVDRNDDDEIIRKKWISLCKHHHPDYLLAKGLPSEFIVQANKELSAINLAYDKIKQQRENN